MSFDELRKLCLTSHRSDARRALSLPSGQYEFTITNNTAIIFAKQSSLRQTARLR
jgi:hypothetical protein